MKDKDFDEIGKRLRGLEAEPPEEGWKKIASEINPKNGTDKLSWFRRNGWKPLVILIPAIVYMVYVTQNNNDRALTVSPTDEAAEHVSPTEGAPASGDTSMEEVGESNRNDNISAAPEETPSQEKRTITGKSTQREERTIVEGNPKSSPKTNDNQAPNGTASPAPNKKQGNSAGESHVFPRSLPDEAEIISVDQGPERSVRPADDSETGSSTLAIIDARGFTQNGDQTAGRSDAGGITAMQAESEVGLTVISREPRNALENTDSLAENNGLSLTEAEENNGDVQKGFDNLAPAGKNKTWRIVGSYTPLFVTDKLSPVTNDDILITDIKNSRSPQKVGLGLDLGAGLSVAPNLFIDATLSYMQVEQTTYYKYSTGQVDTLIATQLPDQTVVVSPVYAFDQAEVYGKYSYGGIRLSGTYYFWANARRRFNVSASAGAHFLMHSEVRKKVDDQWIPLPEHIHKTNYTFAIGAGYNRYLNRGWELMMSPVMVSYLGKTGNGRLPYNQRQRAMGLNIMLSKTLVRMM